MKRQPNSPEISARVAANMGLAWQAALRAWGKGDPRVAFDDVLSAATYALWKCAVAFDPERGNRFSTLAYTPCFRAAYQRFKIERSRKRRLPVTSIEQLFRLPSSPAAAELVVDEEDRGLVIEWVREQLAAMDERDRRIIWAKLVEERTLEEIGEQEGCTRERVRQIVMAISERMLERYRAWRSRAEAA